MFLFRFFAVYMTVLCSSSTVLHLSNGCVFFSELLFLTWYCINRLKLVTAFLAPFVRVYSQNCKMYSATYDPSKDRTLCLVLFFVLYSILKVPDKAKPQISENGTNFKKINSIFIVNSPLKTEQALGQAGVNKHKLTLGTRSGLISDYCLSSVAN